VAGLVGWPAGELGGAEAGGATWVGAGVTVGSPVALGPCDEPAPGAGPVGAGPVGAGPVGVAVGAGPVGVVLGAGPVGVAVGAEPVGVVVELAVGWAGSGVDAGCWRLEPAAARPASAAAGGGSQCSWEQIVDPSRSS